MEVCTDSPECASRGLSPIDLKHHTMWWEGPHWLSLDIVQILKQPSVSELASFSNLEAKSVSCNPAPTEWVEHLYSSYQNLIRVMAWILRFTQNLLAESQGTHKTFDHNLSPREILDSETQAGVYNPARRTMKSGWEQE